MDSSCPELLLPIVSAQPQADGHLDTEQVQLPLHRQLMAIGRVTAHEERLLLPLGLETTWGPGLLVLCQCVLCQYLDLQSRS